jgi:drug/metabolite transporter (DMT)-like permease
LVKLLVSHSHPLALAGLLYGAAGAGLLVLGRVGVSLPGEVGPSREDLPWLAGAALAGGVIAPVLLLLGLRLGSAAVASLLLSLEGVLTGLLAWWIFGESLGPRLAAGMVAIAAGALVLAWAPGGNLAPTWGAAAVAGACLAWAVDNNLTRHVSASDPLRVAGVKGIAAGAVNLALAAASGVAWPGPGVALAAAVVGILGYGVSLALFVFSLRHLGAARTVGYFSTAPFLGAALSLPLAGERLTWTLLLGAGLTGLGVWLHLTEDHQHQHAHEVLAHRHAHTHDGHHDHGHGPEPKPVGDRHGHWHEHGPCVHAHPHYPDLHHRHAHLPGAPPLDLGKTGRGE